jgi:hypothetical protein
VHSIRNTCVDIVEYGAIEDATSQGKGGEKVDPELVRMREAFVQDMPENEKFENFGANLLKYGPAMERSVKREQKEASLERLKEKMMNVRLRP